ncbi:MAG TPA: protoporphyrinogen oxidase [Terriglobia bacterium]|nr:protoporphyrinogen oxidase [Terriglobia bacterium]
MDPVIVVGAGIAGLSCARALVRRGIETVVLEAGNRVGGVVQSERIDGFLVEHGPNTLLPTAHTFQMLEEIGLLDTLIAAPRKAARYVVIQGRLRKIPWGPLSIPGLLRALAEPFVRSKSPEDESVAAFFRRRLGREAHERLAAPFIGGIYAGNAEKLSVAAAFPRLVEIEREYGSIMAGMARGGSRKKGEQNSARKRRSVISSFPDGMQTLPQRMAEGIRVELNSHSVRIGKTAAAAATVLATPAYAAAEVVASYDPDLSEILQAIEYAPIVIATTTLSPENAEAAPQGFGYLAPPTERLNTLGTLFSSSLFPGRAPAGRGLLTSYLGGALKPEAFDWPDTRVWEAVCPELKRLLRLPASPEPLRIFRHRRGIPQYLIGHLRWRRTLDTQLKRTPGLFLTGNYLDGVSLPATLEHGEKTAAAVAEFLKAAR